MTRNASRIDTDNCVMNRRGKINMEQIHKEKFNTNDTVNKSKQISEKGWGGKTIIIQPKIENVICMASKFKVISTVQRSVYCHEYHVRYSET